jgi:hypothetical protein
MKPPRSALPLPRYVLCKPLKSGWAYFVNVPIWARKAGCSINNEPLGADYAKAVESAETILFMISAPCVGASLGFRWREIIAMGAG